ncbi:MAG: serine hydrolase [Bryobacteraceae bacterium]
MLLTVKTLLSVLLPCAVFAVDNYFPKPDSEGGWRTLKDAARIRKVAGMDLERLDRAFEYAQRSSQHGGLLVARRGYLVYEKYYGRGNREANPVTASVGKAFTSIACGIMLQEKKDQIPEGLETKVFSEKYLPEAFPLDDPAKADIKLGHLLTMSSGMHGEGGNPGFVNSEPSVKLQPMERPERPLGQDLSALRTPLWTKPGGGYSYAVIPACRLNRATKADRDGASSIHRRAARQADGLGAVGVGITTSRHHAAHTPGGGDIALVRQMLCASPISCCEKACGASSNLSRPTTLKLAAGRRLTMRTRRSV